jgi:transposase
MALRSKIQQVFGVSVSRQLVQLVVYRLGFTRKRTRKRGVTKRANGEAIRDVFRAQYLEAVSSGTPIVALDESGFDQRGRPRYGYAMRGQPAVLKIRACSDRRRINLLMGIDPTGKVVSLFKESAVNGDTFADFIASLPYPPGTVLLLDNASIHKTKTVAAAAVRNGFRMMYLPPYCPEFNAIELVFGVIKCAFYRSRYENDSYDLLESVRSAVNERTRPATISGCFRHVLGLVLAEQGHKEAWLSRV